MQRDAMPTQSGDCALRVVCVFVGEPLHEALECMGKWSWPHEQVPNLGEVSTANGAEAVP
jgi:hypothetical protein